MNHEKHDMPKPESEEQRQKARSAGDNAPRREHNRRWLFLVVDIALLAAIAAAVFFLISLLTPLSLFESKEKETRAVTYTVEFAGVEKDAFASLKEGDTVTDSRTGAVIGVVSGLEARKYTEYTDRPTAEKDAALDSYLVTKVEYPEDFTTVLVTIVATADYAEGVGYTVEDCRIAVGRAYTLNFPGCTGEGVCVSFAEG